MKNYRIERLQEDIVSAEERIKSCSKDLQAAQRGEDEYIAYLKSQPYYYGMTKESETFHRETKRNEILQKYPSLIEEITQQKEQYKAQLEYAQKKEKEFFDMLKSEQKISISKKEVLTRLQNATSIIKEVVTGRTVDDIPALIAEAEEVAKANNTTINVTDSTIEFVGFTNFWWLPKLEKRTTGKFTLRSKDYVFNGGYGDIPESEMFFNNGKEIGFYKLTSENNVLKYYIEI